MRIPVVLRLLALCFSADLGAAEPSFTLVSPDLPSGKPIADAFTANGYGCHGGDVSPALLWSHAPVGTKSFAVTMFDPFTPPVSGWWHWLVYDIPANVTELKRNAGTLKGAEMPMGAKQALPDGDSPQHRYYGACPDEGDPPHRYTITVYALKVEHLKVSTNSTAANVDYEIISNAIATATIVRPFSRSKK
jgi:Raf kinase inhibitor-like YbhB/YbcL family protein